GRIFRGEGRFTDAKDCFKGCLTITMLPKFKRILIISYLSNLYYKLDYTQQNNLY
ncbi:uncharacterized protein K441DRAFT_570787, partial [Cenococcum geophilum 1.58]|uniref:uncharacterized protein n=1 Tax=Cenococcum geophilum 1.58 TaxID=794803 RepID=UPI00358ED6B6